MIVLPKHYRFKVYNNTGVSIAISNVKVYARRWKFSSTGAISYESSQDTVLNNAGSLATATYLAGDTEDNSTDLFIGGTFMFEVNPTTGSPNGNVILFFERSTDGGTTWDSDGTGDVVAVLNFTSTGAKYKSFSL